ncbi:MAG: hypothetical protein GY903_18910 [Fuerstiella sp.]|nr:hypothetical protein [Fuerstiella sp.]
MFQFFVLQPEDATRVRFVAQNTGVLKQTQLHTRAFVAPQVRTDGIPASRTTRR